jgi:hypothetical protein
MRSDLVARVKSAREKSVNDARGGDDEVPPSQPFCLQQLMVDYEDYFSWGREEEAREDGEGG